MRWNLKDRGQIAQGFGGLSQGLEFYFYLFIYLVFLGLYPHHMEVPRLGVELEMQLLSYTTATAMPDPGWVCNLYHSSRQCQILNTLSQARDPTYILTDPGWSHSLSHDGNSPSNFLRMLFFRKVTDLKKNWVCSTENSHLPHIHTSLSRAYLLQLMSPYWYVIIH